MTITWAVTSSGHRSKQTIIGLGDNPAHARIRLTAATAALIARAGDDEWPRYTLHLGADLAAIILRNFANGLTRRNRDTSASKSAA